MFIIYLLLTEHSHSSYIFAEIGCQINVLPTQVMADPEYSVCTNISYVPTTQPLL